LSGRKPATPSRPAAPPDHGVLWVVAAYRLGGTRHVVPLDEAVPAYGTVRAQSAFLAREAFVRHADLRHLATQDLEVATAAAHPR